MVIEELFEGRLRNVSVWTMRNLSDWQKTSYLSCVSPQMVDSKASKKVGVENTECVKRSRRETAKGRWE